MFLLTLSLFILSFCVKVIGNHNTDKTKINHWTCLIENPFFSVYHGVVNNVYVQGRYRLLLYFGCCRCVTFVSRLSRERDICQMTVSCLARLR